MVRGLQRAAGLVEGVAQRADRRRASRRRRAGCPAPRARARRAPRGSVSGADGVQHGAQQVVARRHQRSPSPVAQEAVQLRPRLRRARGWRTPAPRRAVADAEGAQPRLHLALGQAAAQGLGQHVAGQAALGVVHRALAHQLQRHDRGGLLEDQALEVAQPARVARGEQPRPRGSAAARVDGHGDRPAGEVGVLGGELRRLARRRARWPPGARAPAPPRRPRPRSGSSRRKKRAASVSPCGVQHHHGAAHRRGHRPDQLVQAALLDHQPLEPLVDRRCRAGAPRTAR